jgi:hypothetical protein
MRRGLYMQDKDHFKWVLTDEAAGYLNNGSPEAQVFNTVPPEGLPMAQFKVRAVALQPGSSKRLHEGSVCMDPVMLHGMDVHAIAWAPGHVQAKQRSTQHMRVNRS